MREPTKDEMIEGIAKGVREFLIEQQFHAYRERPLTTLKVAIKEELDAFMRINREEIVKAIAEAAKEKA